MNVRTDSQLILDVSFQPSRLKPHIVRFNDVSTLSDSDVAGGSCAAERGLLGIDHGLCRASITFPRF